MVRMIYCERTEENYSMLKLAGRSDNLIAGIQEKPSFKSVLLGVLHDWKEVQGLPPKEVARIFKQLANNWMLGFGLKIGLVGQIRAVFLTASKEVQDLILKIVGGDWEPVDKTIKRKPPKPPTSIGQFLCLGGLPEPTVTLLLTQVLQCQIKSRDLAPKVKKIKAQLKLRTGALEQLGYDSWDACVLKYGNKLTEIVNAHARTVQEMGAKDLLPQRFYADLATLKEKHKQARKQQKVWLMDKHDASVCSPEPHVSVACFGA